MVFGDESAQFTVILDERVTAIAPHGEPGETVDVQVTADGLDSAIGPNSVFTYTAVTPRAPDRVDTGVN